MRFAIWVNILTGESCLFGVYVTTECSWYHSNSPEFTKSTQVSFKHLVACFYREQRVREQTDTDTNAWKHIGIESNSTERYDFNSCCKFLTQICRFHTTSAAGLMKAWFAGVLTPSHKVYVEWSSILCLCHIFWNIHHMCSSKKAGQLSSGLPDCST